MNTNRQIDKKKNKQILVDATLHQLLKIRASQQSVSIKQLLEEFLADLLGVKK